MSQKIIIWICKDFLFKVGTLVLFVSYPVFYWEIFGIPMGSQWYFFIFTQGVTFFCVQC